MLRRFWIELDSPPVGFAMGCGVTARNKEDVIDLLKRFAFRNAELPNIRTVVDDLDVSTLDANHIQPNMGDPTVRGIWFPYFGPALQRALR